MAIKGIEIVNFGICQQGEGTTKDKSADSPTGYFLHSDEIYFVETTNLIGLRTGLNFGISYQFITDSDEVEIVDFECKICHPLLTNPQTDQHFIQTIEKKEGLSNELGFDFYSIEFDWELQKGEWTFEIIYDRKVMCKQKFELIKTD